MIQLLGILYTSGVQCTRIHSGVVTDVATASVRDNLNVDRCLGTRLSRSRLVQGLVPTQLTKIHLSTQDRFGGKFQWKMRTFLFFVFGAFVLSFISTVEAAPFSKDGLEAHDQ